MRKRVKPRGTDEHDLEGDEDDDMKATQPAAKPNALAAASHPRVPSSGLTTPLACSHAPLSSPPSPTYYGTTDYALPAQLYLL